MKTTMKLAILFALAAASLGCTDATLSNMETLGTPGDIICYSGGKVIYQGRSTGKIQTVDNSDGWEFRDADTHKFVRVSGQCLITN